MVKNLPANAGDTGSIPGAGRTPGEGHDNPFEYSCLKNAWWATVRGGQRSLVGYSSWSAKEPDMTEQLKRQ